METKIKSNKDFGDFVRFERLQKRQNQVDIAEIAGIWDSQISDIENDRHSKGASFGMILAVIEALEFELILREKSDDTF